jgi:hypothetical protein
MDLLAQPKPGPLLQSPADGGVRAAGTGDPLVARAVHQRRYDVFEHEPIRDAAAVAAQWVRRCDAGPLRQQRRELYPERLEQAYW